MKTLQRFLPLAAPLAVAASVVLAGGNLQAFGPGGVGNGTGQGNGVATGTAGFGPAGAPAGFSGGRGGGTVTVSSVARPAVAPSIPASRPSVSFSNTTPRLSTGTYVPGTAARGTYPASSFQNARGTVTNTTPVNPAYQTAAPRVTNAWSGNATTGHYTGTTTVPSRRLYGSNGYTSNRFTGQTLYPGAYGSGLVNANRFTHGNTPGRTDGDGYGRDEGQRHRFRFPFYGYYYGYPFIFASSYAPYYGSYGGYDGAYPYDTSTTSGLNNDPAASNTATANPDFTAPVPALNAEENPQPPQPATTPGAAPGGTVPTNGPDSMVEAVQQELVRRGYFGGKVDAMYGPDTKEALRRFQTDHHLAATGLINEATLHALQLD